jgi:kinetochore protein NDC80
MAMRSDPRNIGDKQFMNGSIRMLIDYLTEHNFDHTISPKILTRPAVKDFNNIMLFLFKEVDSNFVLIGKWEDDVISVFKHLRYPYPISKTNLVAVGSPTAWPALLAATMWIIELLSYDELTAAGTTAEPELDDPSSNEKVFHAYLKDAYGYFLSGEDESYEELERQFVGASENVNADIAAQIEALEEENAKWEESVNEISNCRAYLPELKVRKEEFLSDLNKFQQLIDQLEKHRDVMRGKTASRKSELERLDATIAAVEVDLTTLHARIDTQELSPDDVRRMVEKKEKLQEALTSATDSKSTVSRQVWEAEMTLRDKLLALENASAAYNSTAQDLQLIPHTARNAHGSRLNIEVDNKAKKPAQLMRTDVRTEVIAVLESIKVDLIEQLVVSREAELALQDDCDEATSQLQLQQEQASGLEARGRRLEEAYRREKEVLDTAMRAHDKEIDETESRLLDLRDNGAVEARIQSASRRVAEACRARESRRVLYEKSERERSEAVVEIVTECAVHRELAQTRLQTLGAMYREKLQSLLSTGEATGAESISSEVAADGSGRDTAAEAAAADRCRQTCLRASLLANSATSLPLPPRQSYAPPIRSDGGFSSRPSYMPRTSYMPIDHSSSRVGAPPPPMAAHVSAQEAPMVSSAPVATEEAPVLYAEEGEEEPTVPPVNLAARIAQCADDMAAIELV